MNIPARSAHAGAGDNDVSAAGPGVAGEPARKQYLPAGRPRTHKRRSGWCATAVATTARIAACAGVVIAR